MWSNIKTRVYNRTMKIHQAIERNSDHGYVLGLLTIPPWESILATQGTPEYIAIFSMRGIALAFQIYVLVALFRRNKRRKLGEI